MKRELAQILENKSQLGESLGRTRSSHPESARASADISENSQPGCSSSKRHKGSVVNGVIVYTRGRKARDNVAEAERAEKVKKSLVKSEPARPKSSKAEEFEESELVEVLVKEESNGTLVIKDAKAADKQRRRTEGGAVEVPVLMAGGIGLEKSSAQVVSRRFTRSALKPKVEQKDEERALESEITVYETKVESNSVELESPPSTPNNKLELKMSKKITLNKKPTTVKELFDTGLVDGVPVVYMGGKKAYGLRGTIRDGGIVCSCPVCKGCNVVPPSQFEIHACKQYKRAAQYICLENGRSLLDLLKACRGVPLHTLESTVQSFLNSSPDATYFTCKNCKVSFPPSCVEKDASLCNSCLELQNPQSRLTEDLQDKRNRSSMPVHVSSPQSPKTAPTLISSQNRKDSKLTRKRSSTALLSMKTSKSATPKRAYKKRQKTAAKSKTSSSSLSPKSASAIVTPQNKSASNIKSASAIATPQNKSASKIKSAPQNKSASNIKSALKNKSSSATIAAAISSPKKGASAMTSPSPLKRNQWKITTKDIRLHKLVFEDGGLPDGSEVAYYARGKKLLEGYKKGVGIFCRCCNCEVSPSQFEAHAGWASRRKPYAYIYTSNGVSLHELAVSLSKGRKYSAKDNDDLCIICADGGNLLLCDGCPRAFHRECASLPAIPRGDWYCQYCQNMFQREKFLEYNANALAAGRISGVDSIEQITQRCIRIVKNIEAELSGCVLCRCHDFSKSGFGPRTIILCDQCEKEYHVGCLKKNKMANLKELPRGKWFCCPDCNHIHSTLQKLLVSGAEKIPESLLNTMKKKHEEKGLDTSMGFDVSWRLINGKIASPDSRVMLSKAVAIFHECFDPIVDFQSGRDLIPAMVYGRNVRGQEFGGMYCAILTVNSTVVSAGIIRVFGQEIAELPLVATSNSDHGKGYFQLLFSCIQKLLSRMNVKSLVLPAAEEAEAIWTEKFGFTKIAPDQLSNYRKTCYQMVTFQGTSMLQKKVPENLVNPAPLSEEKVTDSQVKPAPLLEQNVPEIQVNPVPLLVQNVPEIQVNPPPSLEQNVPEIQVNPVPSLEQNVRGVQVNPAPSLEQNVPEIQVNPMPSLEKNVTESLVNSMSSLETNVTEGQVHPTPSSEKNAPESPVNPTAALETDVPESQVDLVSSSEKNNPEFQVNPVQL